MILNEANEPMQSARGYVVGTLFRPGRLMHDARGIPFVDGTLVTEVPREFASGSHKLSINWKSYHPDAARIVPLLKQGVRVRVEGEIVADAFADRREGVVYARTLIVGTVTLLEEVTP